MEEWYQQWNDIAIEYISTTEYPYLDDMYKHNCPLCGKINPHEAMKSLNTPGQVMKKAISFPQITHQCL